MCDGLTLNPEDVLHKAALVMSIYRDVVWVTAQRAEMLREDALAFYGEVDFITYGSELNTALAYLDEFAPTEQREIFENKVAGLFTTKWLIDLIDTAMLRVREYPDNGILYFDILSRYYLAALKYSESELLETFHMERSTFYVRKKEAVLLLGVALWGFAIPELKKLINKNGDTTVAYIDNMWSATSVPYIIPTLYRLSTDKVRTVFRLSKV